MAYATQTDVEYVFGTTNVAKWSQLNPASSGADAARIAYAIAQVDEDINNRFRDSRYSIPFSPVPATVTRWSATLAGLWLYASRGLGDDGDPYKQVRDATESDINAYLRQERRLDTGTRQPQARVPWAGGA